MITDAVNRDFARHLALLCAESYRRAPALSEYEATETVSYSTDDATLFWRPGRLVIAFRGTELTVNEWIWNLIFWPDQWPLFGVRVDAGFLIHFRGLWDQVVKTDLWRRYCDDGKTVASKDASELIYAGHSRGAAIAQLAALNNQPRLVCTFGGPRVGGRSFAGLCARRRIRTWRIVNGLDLVPHLPPPIWFRHYGREYYASLLGRHDIYDYVEQLS